MQSAAAASALAQGIPAKLAGVDCTVDKELCDRFEVSGFPAVKFFRNGKLVGDYGGERKAAALLSFLKDPSAPAAASAEPKWSDEPSNVVHLGTAGIAPSPLTPRSRRGGL